MTMRKRLLGILASVVVIAASCQSSTPSASPQSPIEPAATASAPVSRLADEQVLRVAILDEPATLDPTLSAGLEVAVLRALQRPLVDLNEDSEVVAGLAQSWDISADAQTLTFHLRDAKYSSGDPIVASDLVYSWRRLADPRTAAPYSYVIADVDGGPELLAMSGADLPSAAVIDDALAHLGVEAPDERTFIVRLNRPAIFFLTAATLWVFGPLQERWITKVDATEAANYVSSGPFILDTWQHDSEIILKPNPYWYGDVKPTLTEIRMSIVGAPTQAQLAYEAGEIDLVLTPDGEVRRVRDDPVLGPEYHELPVMAVNYWSFNNFQDPTATTYGNPGPTANKDLRIALIQAIDKQAVIDTTYGGLGQVANSFIMPGIPGHQPDLNPYPYDVESAKRHLDAALAELGVSSAKEIGPLELAYPSGFGREPQAAFLAEAWRQVLGLETEQVSNDGHTFSYRRNTGDFDISFSGWLADYPHASNQLTSSFTCPGNSVQWCNPTFDALLGQAAAERDPDAQVAIYNEAQTLLIEDAAFMPLVFPVTPYEVKPYVSGLAVTPLDGLAPGSGYYEAVQILEH